MKKRAFLRNKAFAFLPPRELLQTISLLVAVTLFTSSCSVLFGSEDEEQPEPVVALKEPAREVRPKIVVPKDKVEVLWEISKTPVDGFVVEYQIEGETRKRQVEVPSKDLERYDDATHGYVYRYLIPDIPSNKRVTVRLTAFEGDQLSQPSEAFDVLPRSQEPRPLSPARPPTRRE